MIPQAIVAVTVALTLKSDSAPVRILVNKPRGTVYWGGAGLNGPYIADQVEAFREVGINNIWIGQRTMSDFPDAGRSGTDLRYQGRSDDRSWLIDGMEKVRAEQFNLVGYSYGSLMAAQTAHVYATNGDIVDHLVLIASPIDSDFLENLRNNKNIKKIIIINLTDYGDPIFAGMSQLRITLSAIKVIMQDKESGTTKGIGHFYYRPDTEEGRFRRRQLAAYLHRQGLR